MGTATKKGSIIDAWNKSCYHEMDYTVSEDSSVYEAVEKMSAYDVGALVTVDAAGT
jgi:predicted transcriptional regulator